MRLTFAIIMGIERPSGRRYMQIARQLVRRGHQVRILALHPDLQSCEQRRFRQDGVEVWYVGQMHARKAAGQVERFGPLALLGVLTRSTLGMLWGLTCSPADHYHLGKPQPINGAAALLGVLLLRRQRFYVDCDDDEVESNRLPAAWQRAVFGFWQWLLPRLSAGATVNTHELEQRVQDVTQVAYVPNGVDLERYSAPNERIVAGLRAALGLEGRQVIAYLGTLALHNHPVDLLIEALALLASEHPALTLLLIGGGEDAGALRELAARRGVTDRVRFIGEVPPSAVPVWLSLALASIDPVHDNRVARARSPLKLFESMALGVPVVTADVGDRSELLDGGRAGVLVAPGDPAALAEGVRGLLGDEVQRRTLAEYGRRYVRRYGWDELAAQWEQIYR